jgi:hypothetical protein
MVRRCKSRRRVQFGGPCCGAAGRPVRGRHRGQQLVGNRRLECRWRVHIDRPRIGTCRRWLRTGSTSGGPGARTVGSDAVTDGLDLFLRWLGALEELDQVMTSPSTASGCTTSWPWLECQRRQLNTAAFRHGADRVTNAVSSILRGVRSAGDPTLRALDDLDSTPCFRPRDTDEATSP